MFSCLFHPSFFVCLQTFENNQRRRAIEALEARAPQYCDCGPDWPLLFKVHEI